MSKGYTKAEMFVDEDGGRSLHNDLAKFLAKHYTSKLHFGRFLSQQNWQTPFIFRFGQILSSTFYLIRLKKLHHVVHNLYIKEEWKLLQ